MFDSSMLNNLGSKLQNDIVGKILVDNYDGGHKQDQIEILNDNNGSNLIQLGCSNRLGEFDEMAKCFAYFQK